MLARPNLAAVNFLPRRDQQPCGGPVSKVLLNQKTLIELSLGSGSVTVITQILLTVRVIRWAALRETQRNDVFSLKETVKWTG